jgi:hypothetical protein
LPDTLRALLQQVLWRRRVRLIADGVAIGGAVFAALFVLSDWFTTSVTLGTVSAAAVIASKWRISRTSIAQQLEAADGTLDNLIVTAVELDERPRPVRREIFEAISTQANARAQAIDVARVVSLMQPVGVALAVVFGSALLAATLASRAQPALITVEPASRAIPPGSITVRITPPVYANRPPETHLDPIQISVLSGSGVRIDGVSGMLREWTATQSESLELRVDQQRPPRFLSVMVIPDSPPAVRIERPGRDTAFASGNATMAVGIDGRDDLGLSSLSLRYTTASGGGENVTFTDGEVPLVIERTSAREWKASANWNLGDLGLDEGDVVVYRAIARDLNPGGQVVESDAFLVEIGRASEVASAGFALPTEERKYAISQQMVIYKTEQLLARKPRPDEWLERSRELAIEQRMVRAEVVFLSGGEVEDEVEEAAHSHELAEGRLENQGRAEMLRAINFMSRAEAQLNDGRAQEALVLERQALASLERALDRRRYFLRTLPDRSRIDLTRRLTGERREARSWMRERVAADASATVRARAVIAALTAALNDPRTIDAAVAARVAAIDPAAPALQQAAVAIAASRDDQQRAAAVTAAIRALTSYALTRLPASTVVPLP